MLLLVLPVVPNAAPRISSDDTQPLLGSPHGCELACLRCLSTTRNKRLADLGRSNFQFSGFNDLVSTASSFRQLYALPSTAMFIIPDAHKPGMRNRKWMTVVHPYACLL